MSRFLGEITLFMLKKLFILVAGAQVSSGPYNIGNIKDKDKDKDMFIALRNSFR